MLAVDHGRRARVEHRLHRISRGAGFPAGPASTTGTRSAGAPRPVGRDQRHGARDRRPRIPVLAAGVFIAASSACPTWSPSTDAVHRKLPHARRPGALSRIGTGTSVGIAMAAIAAIGVSQSGLSWRASWALFALAGLLALTFNRTALRNVGKAADGAGVAKRWRGLFGPPALPLSGVAFVMETTSAIYIAFGADRITQAGGLAGWPRPATPAAQLLADPFERIAEHLRPYAAGQIAQRDDAHQALATVHHRHAPDLQIAHVRNDLVRVLVFEHIGNRGGHRITRRRWAGCGAVTDNPRDEIAIGHHAHEPPVSFDGKRTDTVRPHHLGDAPHAGIETHPVDLACHQRTDMHLSCPGMNSGGSEAATATGRLRHPISRKTPDRSLNLCKCSRTSRGLATAA